MGTNYYIRPRGEECPDPERWIHLGKLNAGNAFSFQAYPFGYYFAHSVVPTWPVRDYGSWLQLFELGEIYDEYGMRVNKAWMRDMIERHRHLPHPEAATCFVGCDGHHFITGYFS